MKKFALLGFVPFIFNLLSCSSVSTRRPELKTSKNSPHVIYRPAGPKGANPKSPEVVTTPTAAGGAPALSNSPQAQQALAYEKAGQNLEALRLLVPLSVSAPTKKEQDDHRLHAIELVETKLNENELHEASRNSDFGFIRSHSLYRLGEISLNQQNVDNSRRYFNGVIELQPGSDLAYKSKEVIDQLEASKRVSPKTIGVVLPLSGKNANIGQRALRGIQMGLGLHQPYSNFKLAVMDSEGNADNARRGVERLVREDNVIALIGSLLGKTALAEITKSSEFNIPTITLSQKSGLTDFGPYVFRNSLTTEMQVRHLVRVAMDSLGMKRFAVMYPNDSYGVETTNIFWDEVLARGGTVVAAQTYNPKDTDFRQAVQRLVGTYYIEARLNEYKQKQKEFFATNKNKPSRSNYNADDLLTPVVDFDGLFIPDSAKTLGQISAFLSYGGVRGVKLMGTNLWNSPGLAKRAGSFSNNILFVDSFTPASLASNRFLSEYKVIYNEDPSLIEIQAYDSALILRQLILQGAASRETIAEKLTSLKEFPGSLGTLQMTSDREIRRPLLTLTLDRGEIVPLKIR
ncbi:MAG: penicillin-binding protein activator [Bdellovibrionota bacterium]